MKEIKKILQTRNIFLNTLKKGYSDIDIMEGGFLVLEGKNGVGKTSYLEVLCGLQDNFTGEINIQKDRVMSYVFDNYSLVGDFSVETNLELENNFKKQCSSRENKEKIISELTKFGMQELLTKKAKWLSSGEKQKIKFIRSIIKKSDILILDEPTAHLDKESSYFMLDEILKISKTQAIILVNHNISEIEYLQSQKKNIVKLQIIE